MSFPQAPINRPKTSATRHARATAQGPVPLRPGIPDSMRDLTRRAVEGRATPAGAIKAFCYECCGYDRQLARTCPTRACPLWPYLTRTAPPGA